MYRRAEADGMREERTRGLPLLVSLLWLLPPIACIADSDARAPDVLFLVVDTLRADHLGAYSDVGLTPNLDAMSRSATVFLDAVSQGSNTINSAPSLLTSTYPSEHGYTNYKLAVSAQHDTLAEILRARGYDTFAISTNPHVTTRNGLAQGFETFLDHPTWTDTDASAVNRLFLDWLDARAPDDDRPFLALLWYVDPHVPYTPPEAVVDELLDPRQQELVSERTVRPGFENLSREEMAVSRLLYQGEVRSFDHAFGELVDELRDRDLFEDALVVFTSDHGESFWEHVGPDGEPVVGHGISLYRTETAVPLLIRFPGGEPAGGQPGRVDTIDIVPTVLGALGMEARGRRFRGRDLMPLLRGDAEATAGSPSVSELLTDFNGTVDIHMESVRTAAGKLVLTYRYRGEDFDPPRLQLLDHLDRELTAATGSSPETTREALLDALERWRASLVRIPPEPVGPWTREEELVERLRALGYLR